MNPLAGTDPASPSIWRARLAVLGVGGLRVAVGLAASAALVVYAVLAVLHLRYPFELEWMEVGLVDEALRAAEFKSLYVKPTVDYVPFIYGPIWFYAAGALSRVFGPGLFSARLISVLASIGILAILSRFAYRESGSKLAGLLAAGLYAASYSLASAFGDLARVDSLFVFFLVAGLFVLRFHETPRARVWAAALFTLACLTKQSGLLAFVPIALALFATERWRALWFVGAGVAFMGGSAFLYQVFTRGWFGYFILWVPRQHPWVTRMWTAFWLEDLMAPLGITCVVAAFYVVVGCAGRRRLFYAAAAAGALAISWTGRLHEGGYPNVIMPGFAVLSLLFALGVQAGIDGAPRPQRRSAAIFFLAAAFAQLGMLAYDPRRLVPSADDRAAGAALCETLRKVDGDVFVPAHTTPLARLAGKRPHAQEQAIRDIVDIGGGEAGADLNAELKAAVASHRFAAVVTDTEFFLGDIKYAYQCKPIFTEPERFRPVTGWRVRPETLYLREAP